MVDRLHYLLKWADAPLFGAAGDQRPRSREKCGFLPERRGKDHLVFIGDSITNMWGSADPNVFNAKTVNRGVGGQTTLQILLRFYPDVIRLRPDILHIMAGTNDMAGQTGEVSDQSIVDNIRAMAVLAKANGIKVIVASITPSVDLPGRSKAVRIVHVNQMLRALAVEQNATYVDYYSAMVDKDGGIPANLANDGLHPNRNGYAVMRPLTERAIFQAARQRE